MSATYGSRPHAGSRSRPAARTPLITSPDTLLDWEQAEIARSRLQARLSHRVEPTAKAVFARYASPAGDTPYAWEYAFHLLADVRGQRVLDLGCGDGGCTMLVASHGARVTALDISTDLLDLARARARVDALDGRVAPLCASGHAIPLAAETIDVVFGMLILHHLDLRRAAAEVHRVLKPGGRAIFTEPIRNSKLLAAVRALIPYRQADVSPFERPLRFDEVDAFAARFESWTHRVFDLPFVRLLRVCGAADAWQSRAYAVNGRLLRQWPQLRHFASVVVFEVRK